MGLDMYLQRRTYVKNWDYMKPEERHEIVVKRGGEVRADIVPSRISHIVEEVAYWRKANAIHKWFVDNCQGGEDKCQETPVDTDKLRELVGLCKKVLSSVETVEGDIQNGMTCHSDGRVEHHVERGQVVAQKGIAQSLLPTQGGFFFGNTDYNEYYLQDLRRTIEMLEPLLDDEEGEYYYRASW